MIAKQEFMNGAKRFLWQGKIGPAFWTVASVFSLVVNVILIAMMVILSRQVFTLKSLLSQQLIGGLYQNFILMDQARIMSSIQVRDTLPVAFNLPVTQETTVRLTRDTRLRGARVNMRTGGLTITNAPTTIILPAGTELPVALDFVVPVEVSVPVNLTVPVDIPLSETELHKPFLGLQQVLEPYHGMLSSAPNSWQDTQFCSSWGGWLCRIILEE
jgi:hypothetical protein